MDGSGNKSLSSKRLSFSKGTDENDQNYQGWSLNVQNPKKPLTTAATKHFMSSTISAASKGNPPRKKILAERNGSLDTHLQKTPTFGSKTSSSIGFGEYEENALLDHLSSRPYDPLTYYISPRPRFLRYKPNRLRDIFLRRENEAREETSSCCGGSLESNNDKDVEDELGTSLADGTQEDDVEKEGVDENEEEFEEVEEERCWSLKGVLNFLPVLVVVVLSSSYISSMNSPTPSPVMQAFGNPKNGMIQDHVYGFANDLVSGNRNYTLVQNGAGIDEEVMLDYEVTGEDEYDDELEEAVEKQNGESEVLKIVEAEEKETTEGFAEGGETKAKETIEHEEKGEIAKLGSVVESQPEERAPEMMVKAGDVFDECLVNVVAMNNELHITEATTMSESSFINGGVGSLAITSSIPENFENEVANEPVKQEVVDGGIDSCWSTTSDQPEYYQIQSDEAEESLKEELKKENALVVFSTLFLVIACLTSAFHFKRKRNAQKNFTPAAQPSFESAVVEKCISMFASEANKNMENILPFTNMMEENCKGTYQRPVPAVVFLGEFEVGEINSLRSCRRRENDVKTPPPLSYGRFTTETHSVPVHVQSAFSETPRPPLSYGRFTTEEKIVKKQREGADGENKNNAVTTPVRRSSRIRNRSIISP